MYEGRLISRNVMRASRLRINGSLFLLLAFLGACSASPVGRTGFRDVVIDTHPLCGGFPEGGAPCQDVSSVSFRIYVNAEIFLASAESAQRYLEEMADSKRGTLFKRDTAITVVGMPFSTATSNHRAEQVVVRIMFTTYPEDMVPPMVSLLVSSEDILATSQAVCRGQPSATYCLEELKAILSHYFEEGR